jgi:hypothetical protein
MNNVDDKDFLRTLLQVANELAHRKNEETDPDKKEELRECWMCVERVRNTLRR